MKPALQLATEGPSQREVELYYFTFEEALDMLKCGKSELRKRLDNEDFGALCQHGKWLIPPAGISMLRKRLWGIR
jgi:hypothetical protein